MKISCQERLVPGDSLSEKVDNLVELGFEGVELCPPFGPEAAEALKESCDQVLRALEGSGVVVSSICGGYPMAFLAGDVAQRKAAVEQCKEVLRAAGQMGAVGPIVVPIFGPAQISDPWPLTSVIELERDIMAGICRELAEVAAESGTNVILEPLNRYETHFMRTLSDAVHICQMAGGQPELGIMADFFHMNIEEPDIPGAIRQAGDFLLHVHLADNTRTEPGSGHTDFAAGLGALRDIGFSNFMAFECGLSGHDPLACLGKSVTYLKSIRDSL